MAAFNHGKWTECVNCLQRSLATFDRPLDPDMGVDLYLLCKASSRASDVPPWSDALGKLQVLVNNTLYALGHGHLGDRQVGTIGPVLQCTMETLAFLCRELGLLFSHVKRNDDFDFYCSLHLDILSKVHGPDSIILADAQMEFAVMLAQVRDFHRALTMADESLATRISHLGDFDYRPPHPRVADGYFNVGVLNRVAGDSVVALQCLLTCLDMRSRMLASRREEAILEVIMSIGMLHHQTRNFRTAFKCYEEVYLGTTDAHRKAALRRLLDHLHSDVTT